MRELMQTLLRDERGQDLVEYILILVIIAVASIAVVASFGEDVNNHYEQTANEVQNALTS